MFPTARHTPTVCDSKPTYQQQEELHLNTPYVCDSLQDIHSDLCHLFQPPKFAKCLFESHDIWCHNHQYHLDPFATESKGYLQLLSHLRLLLFQELLIGFLDGVVCVAIGNKQEENTDLK